MKRRVNSLTDFQDWSKQYLELEQIEIASRVMKEKAKSPPPTGKDEHGGNIQDFRGCFADNRTRGSKAEGKYEKYTPLKVSREQLWKEVSMTEMMKSNKCQYGGQSKTPPPEKKRKDQKKKVEDSDDEFPEAKYECNVISVAFGGEGDPVSQRKKYLREVLSIRDCPKFKKDLTKSEPPILCFTKEDLQDVALGHHDGLVITGTVVNCRVRKIFVDNRSVVDIILWGAFKRMKLDPRI
ncbi:hypothetical protein K1719_026949 [Acacia pycnantha]|nr:hypothetical protein K1719_026949 [Acacia pycnantha]